MWPGSISVQLLWKHAVALLLRVQWLPTEQSGSSVLSPALTELTRPTPGLQLGGPHGREGASATGAEVTLLSPGLLYAHCAKGQVLQVARSQVPASQPAPFWVTSGPGTSGFLCCLSSQPQGSWQGAIRHELGNLLGPREDLLGRWPDLGLQGATARPFPNSLASASPFPARQCYPLLVTFYRIRAGGASPGWLPVLTVTLRVGGGPGGGAEERGQGRDARRSQERRLPAVLLVFFALPPRFRWPSTTGPPPARRVCHFLWPQRRYHWADADQPRSPRGSGGGGGGAVS